MRNKLLFTLVLYLVSQTYCLSQEVPIPEYYDHTFVEIFGIPRLSLWGFEKKYDDVRIMVNDFNVNKKSDLDFNDLVFDARFTDKGVRVTIRAVGTTSAIKVGGKEAHELFNVPTSTIINTNELLYDPITIEIEGEFEGNYNNIKVETQDKGGNWYLLPAYPNDVSTNKLAVPTTDKWCMENEFISDIYPDFQKYIREADCKWWENYHGNISYSLVGTWQGSYISNGKTYYEQWTFNSNGTGSMTDWQDGNEKKSTDPFTYTSTDSQVSIDWGDGSPEVYQYSISGTSLTLTRGGKSTNYIRHGGETGIRSVLSNNDVQEVYSISGNKLKSPSKGINIIKQKDGTTKKVLIKY